MTSLASSDEGIQTQFAKDHMFHNRNGDWMDISDQTQNSIFSPSIRSLIWCCQNKEAAERKEERKNKKVAMQQILNGSLL